MKRTCAAGDVVAIAAGQHLRERAFAAAVRPHDGVHFAGVDGQVDPFEDFLAVHAGMQIFDFEQTHRLSNAAFQADAEQFLCFHGEFHRQFTENFLAEAIDDHVDRVFVEMPRWLQIKNLVFADLRSGASCSTARDGVLHFDVRERVRAALVAQQQRIALRVVARARGALQDLHQAAIGVLPVAGGNAFGDDRALVFLPTWIILVPVSAC